MTDENEKNEETQEVETVTTFYCEVCDYNQKQVAKFIFDDSIYLCEEHASVYSYDTPDMTVAKYFHLPTLRQYLTADESWFKAQYPDCVTELGSTTVNSSYTTKEGQKVSYSYEKDTGYYIYQDNGSKILAVAHLDKAMSAPDRKLFRYYEDKDGHPSVLNGNLDDRIGAYIICYVLPSLGLNFDLLLTTNEESGGSTAEYFKLPEGKQYNWIIEFDRRGTDAVLYQYDSGEWREAVKKHINVEIGTFSDISLLNELGCKAANWGTGYYREHSKEHHADLIDSQDVIDRFLAFHEEYKDTHFPHSKDDEATARSAYWWNEDDFDYYAGRSIYGRYLRGSNETSTTHYGVGSQVCHECGRFVSRRWSTVDPQDGRTLLVCRVCYSDITGKQPPVAPQLYLTDGRNRSRNFHLVCDKCNEQVAFTVLMDGKELCYNCALNKKEEETEKCAYCQEEYPKSYLTQYQGVPLCPFCFEREMSMDD